MVGTRAGGLKAAKTNKERRGEDFYAQIGAKGGRNGCGPDYKGGFASNRELAKEAGRRGGLKSRRGPATRDAEGNLITKDGRKYTGGRPRKVDTPEPEPEKKGLFSKIFGGK